jgi:signal transduction histidine kinase
VRVTLSGSSDSIMLEVQDNGTASHTAQNGHAPPAGYGLLGLRERVALLDGRLAFGPSSAGGSCLRVTLPIHGRLDVGDPARV